MRDDAPCAYLRTQAATPTRGSPYLWSSHHRDHLWVAPSRLHSCQTSPTHTRARTHCTQPQTQMRGTPRDSRCHAGTDLLAVSPSPTTLDSSSLDALASTQITNNNACYVSTVKCAQEKSTKPKTKHRQRRNHRDSRPNDAARSQSLTIKQKRLNLNTKTN